MLKFRYVCQDNSLPWAPGSPIRRKLGSSIVIAGHVYCLPVEEPSPRSPSSTYRISDTSTLFYAKTVSKPRSNWSGMAIIPLHVKEPSLPSAKLPQHQSKQVNNELLQSQRTEPSPQTASAISSSVAISSDHYYAGRWLCRVCRSRNPRCGTGLSIWRDIQPLW